jgi:hypothetical protein
MLERPPFHLFAEVAELDCASVAFPAHRSDGDGIAEK